MQFTNIGVLIDYPYGLADTKVREHELIFSVRNGVKYADISINRKFLENNDFKKIIEEITIFNKIIKGTGVELRVIIESLYFPVPKLNDICTCLFSYGINYVIFGSGIYNNDINDNIINAAIVNDTVPINIILGTQFCTKESYEILKKSKLSGIRLTSQKSLERIL